MEMGPEMARLDARLKAKVGLVHIHFSVGGAHGITAEDVAREANRALDQAESGVAFPLDFMDSKRPKTDVRAFVETHR